MKNIAQVILSLAVSAILAACGGADSKVQVAKNAAKTVADEATDAELQALVDARVAAAIAKMKREAPRAGPATAAAPVEAQRDVPPYVEAEEPDPVPLHKMRFTENAVALLEGKTTVSGNTKPRTTLEARDERERQRDEDYRLPGLKDLRDASNHEGKVAIDCIENTASIALAIECTAVKLTTAELSKCVNRPGECFGPDNTLRRRMEYIAQQAASGNFAPSVAPFALPTPDDIKNIEATYARAQKAAEDAARRVQADVERERALAEAKLRRLEEQVKRELEEARRRAEAAVGGRVGGAVVGGVVMGPVGIPLGGGLPQIKF